VDGNLEKRFLSEKGRRGKRGSAFRRSRSRYYSGSGKKGKEKKEGKKGWRRTT